MRHHGDGQGALAVPPTTEGESSLRLDRKVVTGGGGVVGRRVCHLIPTPTTFCLESVQLGSGKGIMDDADRVLVET